MKFELTMLDLEIKLGEPTRISLDIRLEDKKSVIHCRNLTGDIWIGNDTD